MGVCVPASIPAVGFCGSNTVFSFLRPFTFSLLPSVAIVISDLHSESMYHGSDGDDSVRALSIDISMPYRCSLDPLSRGSQYYLLPSGTGLK